LISDLIRKKTNKQTEEKSLLKTKNKEVFVVVVVVDYILSIKIFSYKKK
jgi:hypothetical protein